MAFPSRLALLLDKADVAPAAEIVVLVAADAGVAAVVVPVRAVVAATPAAELRRAAAIASPSTQGNDVRVALRRGPFACSVPQW